MPRKQRIIMAVGIIGILVFTAYMLYFESPPGDMSDNSGKESEKNDIAVQNDSNLAIGEGTDRDIKPKEISEDSSNAKLMSKQKSSSGLPTKGECNEIIDYFMDSDRQSVINGLQPNGCGAKRSSAATLRNIINGRYDISSMSLEELCVSLIALAKECNVDEASREKLSKFVGYATRVSIEVNNRTTEQLSIEGENIFAHQTKAFTFEVPSLCVHKGRGDVTIKVNSAEEPFIHFDLCNFRCGRNIERSLGSRFKTIWKCDEVSTNLQLTVSSNKS